MKKLILFLFAGIFLMNFVWAENCKIAWPQFGVVECDMAEELFQEVKYSLDCQSQSPYYCSFNFDCSGKLHCNVYANNINLDCGEGGWAPFIEVYKDGSSIPITYNRVPPLDILNFQSVLIKGYCKGTFLGIDKKNFEDRSSITMSYKNKYLYDTNFDYPRHKVEESIGCIPNGIMYKSGYTSQLPSSWINANGDNEGTKPSNLKDSLPTNMNEGDTYSYLYSWREVSGINVINGKDGNLAGYCGGSLRERKLFSYSEVSGSSECYLIPTSIQKNVECCYNEDCKWKGDNYVCDPSTFTCSLERPCNSDYDCQIIGEESCRNNLMTSWGCDLSLSWQPYKGTCKQSTKNVLCCSDNDCSKNEYCDKELGCKPQYKNEECPSDKCCISGGDYKEKLCNAGECCTAQGSFVGICAVDCSSIHSEKTDTTSKNLRPITEAVIGEENNKLIWIILIILIIIGTAGGLIYLTKKNQSSSILKKRNCCEKSKKLGKKFCVDCGKKINR